MVHPRILEDQLRAIGARFKFFGRPEVNELCNLLNPDEVVSQAMNGYYEGGFALLCVTNHRLLLIDRKPLFLTLEDIRFDMISEVDYNHQMFTATARIFTPNKKLVFTTFSHGRLKQLVHIVQEQVLKSRQLAQMTPEQQFANYAQAQIAQNQPAKVQHTSYVSLTPALAQTAINGASVDEKPESSFAFSTSSFSAPLSRNPYIKSPLKTFRKFRNY